MPTEEPTPTAPALLQSQGIEAAFEEAHKALRIGRLLAGPVGLLVLLALGRALASASAGEESRFSRWTNLDFGGALPREDFWITSHLTLAFFLIAGQFVCVLLAWEHCRTIREIATGTRQLRAGAAGRLVALAAVLLALLLTLTGGSLPFTGGRVAPGSWWAVFVVVVMAEVIAGIFLLVTGRQFSRSGLDRHLHELAERIEAEEEGEAATARTHHRSSATDAELLAIGASGGGIRAASFVLGGLNALQERDGFRKQPHEPEVFAVSGGSYTAAAMALRRRFDKDTGEPRPPLGWDETFTVGSPELDYLRRRTRYLFEPGSRLRDGLVSLLVGATINLLIVAMMLRGLAWFSAQFAVTAGIVDVTVDGSVDGFEAGGLSVNVARLLLWVVGLVALAITVGTVGRWVVHRRFDRGGSTVQADLTHMSLWGRLRTQALLLGIVIVLLVAVPAVTVRLVEAVGHNSPTTMVAGALRASGFSTETICANALEDRVLEASSQAETRARLSPDTERSVDTGACGVSVTVSRTAQSLDDADPANDLVSPIAPEHARALAGQVSTPVQVGTIIALLGTVLGFLTRGPGADTAREGKLLGRIKRVVLTWVPLLITALIGLYLLVLWHLHFLIGSGRTAKAFEVIGIPIGLSALILIGVGVIAFFLDANSTSMHQFYRERLSSAFAVGVDDERTSAAELPGHVVYRFSALSEDDRGPRLNVVTTLNTQAAHEVPTLRGGLPFVFSPDHVDLHQTHRAGTRVPTDAYETFAGPGRTSIMATVAMSGAAISPLMGRMSDQMKTYRILLTLFNLRVGMWMLNPAQTTLVDGEPPGPKSWLSVTSRPGAFQVLREAVGRSSMADRWVYVSDGGHLDNTAMVECVRHAAQRTPPGKPLRGRVVILDASNDPPGAWSAIGDALNVVRADLGIDLVRKFTPGEPPWLRQFVQRAGATGQETFQVIVIKAVRVEAGTVEGDIDWHRRLPEPVKSTQLLRPDFPRSSTARQRFGDLEFEAYRAFGYAAVSEALRFLDGQDG